jgi:hypothetical protein
LNGIEKYWMGFDIIRQHWKAQDGIGRLWMAQDGIERLWMAQDGIERLWMALIATGGHCDSKWQLTASKCSRCHLAESDFNR